MCETLLPVCRIDVATRGGHVHHHRTRPLSCDRITAACCRLYIQRLPDQPVGRRQGRLAEDTVKKSGVEGGMSKVYNNYYNIYICIALNPYSLQRFKF